MGLLALTLGLPQASEAGGSAELPGFGLLATASGCMGWTDLVANVGAMSGVPHWLQNLASAVLLWPQVEQTRANGAAH